MVLMEREKTVCFLHYMEKTTNQKNYTYMDFDNLYKDAIY